MEVAALMQIIIFNKLPLQSVGGFGHNEAYEASCIDMFSSCDSSRI